MIRFAWLAVSLLLLWAAFGPSAAAIQQQKTTPKKTSPSKAYSSKTYSSSKRPMGKQTAKSSKSTKQASPSRTYASRSHAAANTKQNRRYAGKRTKNWVPPNHFTRIGQQKPAPERIAEIKRALAQRGYLQGQTDGAFDDHTADALRRFQQDQNLRADGKLNALSLIALGLGPRRMSAPPATRPALPPGGLSALQPVPPLPALAPPAPSLPSSAGQFDN